MPTTDKPVVLIAPLDWGLGHATRCIPIIRFLMSANYNIIIAAEGAQKKLLETEFPTLKIVHLPGYRLRYGRSKWKTVFNIFLQVPKIFKAIRKENDWLKNFVANNTVNYIISDNRYGFYFHGIPSFFITHQLLIKTPFGKRNEKILQKFNYRFIQKFTACWVPDYEGKINLAGDLSHPTCMPSIPVHYLGYLTRMKKAERKIVNDILVLISGPEPQRTLFEKIIVDQLSQINLSVTIVRGLPNEPSSLLMPENVKVYNHLPAADLNNIINESSIVICRSGYSTVMDLIPLHKKCIFVPTPGQTEQEYLANYLSEKDMCISVSQDDFDLQKVLHTINEKSLKTLSFPQNHFERSLERCLNLDPSD